MPCRLISPSTNRANRKSLFFISPLFWSIDVSPWRWAAAAAQVVTPQRCTEIFRASDALKNSITRIAPKGCDRNPPQRCTEIFRRDHRRCKIARSGWTKAGNEGRQHAPLTRAGVFLGIVGLDSRGRIKGLEELPRHKASRGLFPARGSFRAVPRFDGAHRLLTQQHFPFDALPLGLGLVLGTDPRFSLLEELKRMTPALRLTRLTTPLRKADEPAVRGHSQGRF
jgi:hypothetical protein